MATPTITAATRFTDQSNTKIYYIPTIAATNLTPTRTEMNAGTDLSPQINDIKGWTVTSNLIETPDLGTSFVSKIAGSTVSADSALTFYTSKNGTDVRSVLPRGTTGYIAMLDGGDTPGNKMEVYPVTVTSNGVIRTAQGKDASKVQIDFAITAVPGQQLTVPA